MVVFLVNDCADGKSDNGVSYRKKRVLNRGNLVVENYDSEILDINEYRVAEEESFIHAEAVGCVEYRRHIHKKKRKDAPKVLHVTEENVKSRKYKTDSNVENDEAENRNYKKEKAPGKGYTLKNAESKEHDESKTEVYKR